MVVYDDDTMEMARVEREAFCLIGISYLEQVINIFLLVSEDVFCIAINNFLQSMMLQSMLLPTQQRRHLIFLDDIDSSGFPASYSVTKMHHPPMILQSRDGGLIQKAQCGDQEAVVTNVYLEDKQSWIKPLLGDRYALER